jgi:hypothetical protein
MGAATRAKVYSFSAVVFLAGEARRYRGLMFFALNSAGLSDLHAVA